MGKARKFIKSFDEVEEAIRRRATKEGQKEMRKASKVAKKKVKKEAKDAFSNTSRSSFSIVDEAIGGNPRVDSTMADAFNMAREKEVAAAISREKAAAAAAAAKKAARKEAAKSYSGRYSNPSMNENRATRKIVKQNDMKPLWKPDTVKNSNIKKEARQIKIDDRAQAYGELSKKGYDPASDYAQLAAEKRAKEIKNQRIKSYHSKSNSSSEKDNKFFNQKNIRRAVGAGVTGALVLGMFNNGGQQSNAELYGQQQQRY